MDYQIPKTGALDWIDFVFLFFFFFSFINSSKKSKSKTNQLFDDDKNNDTQPEIKELLGLCSGRFSDSEDSKASKSIKRMDKTKKYQKGEMFDTQSKQHNMDELLGLCTGKFTDDENEGEDDDLVGGEKDGNDVELEEQEDRSKEEEDENMTEMKSEEGGGSDPEEMILKRKFGKKYEAKRRYSTSTYLWQWLIVEVTRLSLLWAMMEADFQGSMLHSKE